MKRTDIVIIGSTAADIPAAITCRRHYPDKKVVLIRKEKHVQISAGKCSRNSINEYEVLI